ncbi:peptidase S24 [Companilactobacillus farciminis]|nr:peptidase S24 [Companilactobacillus farciminis]
MSCVDQFVDLIVNSDNDYQELDKTYLYNRICALVGDDNHQTDDDIKTALIKTAIKNGKIEDNQTAKEILNDQLMDFVTPLPSKVNAKFWNLYQKKSRNGY